jgi:hypothetical protein
MRAHTGRRLVAIRKVLVSFTVASAVRALLALSTMASAAEVEPAAQAPFTCLFDTGAPSVSALSADALVARTGWAAVPEDNLTHSFAGDAVFVNDRVAVVVRRNMAGAEVYTKSARSFKHRAALMPLATNGETGSLSAVKTIENSQAAVMIEASFKTSAGAAAAVRFRLTAGESLLDVRGAQGLARLRVCDQAKYVVVPDFFADDMVFDPAAQDGARIGLPAENSVLGLADGGQAIVACVWASTRQNVDLLPGSDRAIAGYEVDLPADARLWIAVMEGAGIWHARRVTDQKAGAELALEWMPPYPARWRADFAPNDGAARSCYFADAEHATASETSKSDASCRFESNRAWVRLGDGTWSASARLVVIYPIERTRTTPLSVFCLVDIMRNALGVGPCQYVLDAERLGAADNPTPDQVTRWVEKQFEKKPAKRDPDAIREQLAKMALQMKRTDARIGEYVEFGKKVKQACASYARGQEKTAAVSRLLAIADGMSSSPTVLPTVEKFAGELAGQIERDDALTRCEPFISGIRAAGAARDYALARFRMAARRLKQESRTLAAGNPQAAAFAAQIQQQAEQMLLKK